MAVHTFCGLSQALIYTYYAILKPVSKLWVMVLTVFVTTLCWCTNSNIPAWVWICWFYFLARAMEAFADNKTWPRVLTTVQVSPRVFSGVLPLDCFLQELVDISAILLSTGSFLLRAWLGPLSQPSYAAFFLSSLLCTVQATSIHIRLLGRSVEFSFDQEAQNAVEILGGLWWLESPRVHPEIKKTQ